MASFPISRITLGSLLLGLLIASGIRLRDINLNDDCTRYMAGDKSLPASQWVVSGTRTVEVACNNWFARQPLWMQVLYLVDVLLAMLFALNALHDLRGRLLKRRQIRSAQ
jgi:hypothetical protein